MDTFMCFPRGGGSSVKYNYLIFIWAIQYVTTHLNYISTGIDLLENPKHKMTLSGARNWAFWVVSGPENMDSQHSHVNNAKHRKEKQRNVR